MKYHPVDPGIVIEHFDEGAMIQAARLERVLYDATVENYGDDLYVSLKNSVLIIQILNFAANQTNLTESQQKSLNMLGAILVDEISSLNYGMIVVTGHANPTGVRGEGNLLLRISQSRAETMADVLRNVGLKVDKVQGMGSHMLLGDTKTLEGRSLNRRVENTGGVNPVRSKILYLITLSILLAACASTEVPPEPEVIPEPEIQEVIEPEPDLPEWVLNPPFEEGMVFGIGSDMNPDTADQQAFADIVWQLSSRLKSLVLDPSTADAVVKRRIIASQEYIVDVVEWDGEIIDEYNASDGMIWKLARMPIYNAMDIAESVLKSYSEELEIDEEDMNSLIFEVEKKVPMERVENPANQ